MNYENYFKDMFETIPDYRKIVLLLFLFKNDSGLLTECGLLKNDIIRVCKEFKKILIEQNEKNLDYIKKEKESNIEKILNK